MQQNIFDTMRAALQPQGTAPVVRLGFDSPISAAYFDKDFVHECLDTLEKRCRIATAGIDPLNPLERLAAELLKSSAGLPR